MKTPLLVIAAILALSCSTAHATNAMSIDPLLTRDYRANIRLRNAGIGLVVAGTVATIAGALMVNQGLQNAFCDSCTTSDSEDRRNGQYFDAGTAILTLGQLAVVIGIPLWATGGVRAKKISRLQVAPDGARVIF